MESIKIFIAKRDLSTWHITATGKYSITIIVYREIDIIDVLSILATKSFIDIWNGLIESGIHYTIDTHLIKSINTARNSSYYFTWRSDR